MGVADTVVVMNAGRIEDRGAPDRTGAEAALSAYPARVVLLPAQGTA